jgi:YggT family protein
MIDALLWLFNTAVFLYVIVIVAMVIMSWLTGFKVVDPHQPFVAQFDRSLYALTNPALNPVRRLVPAIRGVDISPIIVVLLLEFVRRLVDNLLTAAA